MKILMVSIFAPHFFNWTEQLKDSGHELYWLDILDSNTKVDKIDFVDQIIGWRYKCNYPGRYFLKQKAPAITQIINKWNERDLNKFLEMKIKEIQPDVIHSFVMYLTTVPIYPVMQKHPGIQWIFSSWGSDMYYYSRKENYEKQIRKVLPSLDYMFSDCKRDEQIAVNLGFKGQFLGVYPGGGGYVFEKTDPFIHSFEKRKVILIKGYQGLHGKCIEVLKSLATLKTELIPYQIVIFGASPEVLKYASNSEISGWDNFEIFGTISHQKVIELMGDALIYIGNSTSDGMPNTLLEAIIMGAFPIQSNPGGASGEIINDGYNGLLIQNPTDIIEISEVIKKSLLGEMDILKGITYNLEKIKPLLERNFIKKQVMEKYALVENEIMSKNIE